MIGLLTVLGALLLGARAQQQEFRLEGSDVILVPKYTGDLREIKWLLDDRIFVELKLKPEEETLTDLTKDRTTINKTNGALTIRNLAIGDSGVYKAEALVKSIEYTEIRLTVRGCPDQPTISVESTEDQFVVSCKSVSPDVTYEWFNQTTSVSKSRSYTEDKKHGTLTCVVDNKVCNKSSSINFYIPAQPEVKTEGDEVTLVPQYTGDPSEIIWKVNGYKLVKMMLKPQVDTNFYRLKGRATISETDGSLTLRGLTMEDSGDYTAVVLVNNEYYYTDRRLPALKSRDISGWIIAVLVCEVLSLIAIILLQYYYYKKKKTCQKEHLKPFDVEFIAVKDSNNEREEEKKNCREEDSTPHKDSNNEREEEKKNCREEDSTPHKVAEVKREEESESCITVKFCNDDKSQTEESCRLLENRSKGTQSPRLNLHGVESVGKENFTVQAVLSDRKEDTFTDGKKNKEKESDPKIHVKELVWKKNGVTMFKWAVSSLKFHASNIKLKRESVTVYDAEGKKSYKVTVYDAEGKKSYRVFFQLEEPPKSKSICSITFHPIKMTGIDPSTWKKDSQRLNTEGGRITCKPNGDLTIYDATSEDKGKYTVQCIDNELVQEFILHL